MAITKEYTEEQEKIALRIYVEEQRGQKYTADKAHCSIKVLKKILKDNNIPIRTFGQAAIVSNQNRSYKKDESYFSRQSHNMAWMVGFLAANGCISQSNNTISLALARVDREILEKIKAELSIEAPIKDYITNNGYEASSLHWSCKQHKEDLKKYSVVPRKTFILTPPLTLKQEYWIDYIRGYFDGDGSINLVSNGNHRGGGNLRWQVCSATSEILEFILDFFESEYGIPKVSIQKQCRAQHPLYSIQYSSTSTRKIYEILYTPNSLFLTRKKNKFEKVIASVRPLHSSEIEFQETLTPQLEE